MTEVAEIRRAYKADEITNVAWITSANNPADGLTRSEYNKVLDRALRSGVLQHEVGEWICKNYADPDTSTIRHVRSVRLPQSLQ